MNKHELFYFLNDAYDYFSIQIVPSSFQWLYKQWIGKIQKKYSAPFRFTRSSKIYGSEYWNMAFRLRSCVEVRMFKIYKPNLKSSHFHAISRVPVRERLVLSTSLGRFPSFILYHVSAFEEEYLQLILVSLPWMH